MPRTYPSAFHQFQRRARAALTDLRREISARETELGELRDEGKATLKVGRTCRLVLLDAALSETRPGSTGDKY